MRLCQRHGRIVPGHSNPTKKEFMSDQTTEQSSQQAAAAGAPDAAQRPNVDVSMFGPIPGEVVAAMLAGAARVARVARDKGCGEGCGCAPIHRVPTVQELAAYMEVIEKYTPESGDLVRLNAVGREVFDALPGGMQEARIGRVLPEAMFERGAEIGKTFANHVFDCTVAFMTTLEVGGSERSVLVEEFFNSELLELVGEPEHEAETEAA